MVREYIGKNHDFCSDHRGFHQLEVVFHCQLNEPALVGKGIELDKKQIGVEWLPLAELMSVRLYPRALQSAFLENAYQLPVEYWGDVN